MWCLVQLALFQLQSQASTTPHHKFQFRCGQQLFREPQIDAQHRTLLLQQVAYTVQLEKLRVVHVVPTRQRAAIHED